MKKEGGGRSIEERDNSLYNALKSIYEDSLFVDEVSQQWPQLPVVANLHCSLWYSPSFHSTSYFEYTDDNCLFNTSCLNLHLAHLAGQKGGCIIVDSTRRQKRFPDSLSKTIPIWTCVLNRAIAHFRRKFNIDDATSQKKSIYSSSDDEGHVEIAKAVSCDWDCSLHLPGWVSQIEKASIEAKLDEWTEQFKFKASEANIASLAVCLKKPLRPLWLSQTQKSAIKLNNDSWNFTPIILVSASSWISVRQYRTTSIFWWDYIPGAGDEAETWARGLSPTLFWNHVYDLINSSPDACKQKVIDIVEKSKVPCAYIGESAPQIKIKIKPLNLDSLSYKEPSPASNISNIKVDIEPFEGLAVGASQLDSMSRVSKFASYQRQLADKTETAGARKGMGTTPIDTPAVVVASPRSQAIPEVVAQLDHGGKEKEQKHSNQTQLPYVPQGSNEVFPSGVNTDFWGEIDFHVNKAVDHVGEAVKRGRELEAEVVELRKLKQRVEDSVMNEQVLKAQNEELKHANKDLNKKLQNTASLLMKLGEEERKVKTLTKELKKAEKERLAALKQKNSFRQKRDFLLREHKSAIVLLRRIDLEKSSVEESKRKLVFELAKVKKQFDEVEKLHKEAEEDCVAIGQEQFDNAISQILALNPGVAIRTDGATSIGLVEGCNIINAETKEVLLPLPPSASSIDAPATCFNSTTPP